MLVKICIYTMPAAWHLSILKQWVQLSTLVHLIQRETATTYNTDNGSLENAAQVMAIQQINNKKLRE